MLIGVGLDRERLRHEPDLRVWLQAAVPVGVEDAVEGAPVVDRPALGVLGVGIGAAPLEGGRAVAGGEQVVGAEVDRERAELAQLRDQLPAVLHGRVVGLVRPEEAPDRLELSQRPRGIDLDRDREGAVGGQGGSRRPRGQEEREERTRTHFKPRRRAGARAARGVSWEI